MIQSDFKVKENRIRRWATRLGYTLEKSRAKRLSIDNLLEYRLVDPFSNTIVGGEKWDMGLDEIESFLKDIEKAQLEKIPFSASKASSVDEPELRDILKKNGLLK